MSAPAPAPAHPHADKPWLKWAILVTASLGALLEVIDTSIVNVALTDIQASLGATLSEVGWVVTIYAIANVIILPLTAWLGDRFGKKNYFIFSLVAFTSASILCGLSTSLPMLIFARLLQGLGGGGLLAKGQAILFETFPPSEQPMAQAVFGICVIAGPAIGPTLGGYLTTNLDWRWIFFINLPVGIAATFMAVAFLKPEPPKAATPVDWSGIVLLVVAVGSLQTLLEEGNQEDWFESNFIRALAVGASVGLALFIWRQLTAKYPVVDLRVLRHRSLAAGSAFSIVLGMGLYGALFAVPIFAQGILGFTAQQTGNLLLPGAIASALMFPIVGKFGGKIDARVLIGAGALTLVLAMVQLSGLNVQTSKEALFWPLIIRGAGTVLMFLPLSLATIGPLPRKDISAASGFYNLTRQLGGSMGIAILTTLLDQRSAFHRNVLIEKLSATAPATLDRVRQYTSLFLSRGFDLTTARAQALQMLDRVVDQQARILSFADTFYFVGGALLCTLPLLLLLGNGKGVKAAPDAH